MATFTKRMVDIQDNLINPLTSDDAVIMSDSNISLKEDMATVKSTIENLFGLIDGIIESISQIESRIATIEQ